MCVAPMYSEWKRSWPELIVQTCTGEAVDLLQAYFAIDGNQPRFTGSCFESMAALNQDPNMLGPADFLAVTMLSVDVPAEAAIRLLGRDSALVGELLHEIPSDVDIVDVDPQMLCGESPGGRLWDVLRKERDGLGPTRASKLLAAKRPRLLPIWDTFVEEATGMGTLGCWVKFQYVLKDDDRRVWMWLRELRSLATNVPASVSDLRILDVLLWMSVHSQRRQGS
ncbi:hypothetical protein A9W97_18785 [Mycobacterium gordonae]|nr:hypothetical protein A9W97_18785 [Mycobacterium gordonae]